MCYEGIVGCWGVVVKSLGIFMRGVVDFWEICQDFITGVLDISARV
jgi:hypothetical protein